MKTSGVVYIAGYEGPDGLDPIERLLLQWQGLTDFSVVRAHDVCLVAALTAAQISCLSPDVSSSAAAPGLFPNQLRVMYIPDGRYVDLMMLRRLGDRSPLLAKDSVLPADVEAAEDRELREAIAQVTEDDQPGDFLAKLTEICTQRLEIVRELQREFPATVTTPIIERALTELWSFEKFDGFLQGVRYHSGLSDPR